MNKNGWGLRMELFFILIFIVCLMIATIGLNKFGILGEKGAFDVNKKTYSYSEMEQLLSSGALKYYKDRYAFESHEEMILSDDVLSSNGYVPVLYDENGRYCSGYAKVLNGQTSVAYVKCPLYKTSGYDKKYE